jgi:hypothetical protein
MEHTLEEIITEFETDQRVADRSPTSATSSSPSTGALTKPWSDPRGVRTPVGQGFNVRSGGVPDLERGLVPAVDRRSRRGRRVNVELVCLGRDDHAQAALTESRASSTGSAHSGSERPYALEVSVVGGPSVRDSPLDRTRVGEDFVGDLGIQVGDSSEMLSR